jgi:hypothetical protein
MSSTPVNPAATAANPEFPSEKILMHAAKLAIEQDKPVLLDYFKETRSGSAFLGQDKETGEQILVKSPEEYTSPVGKLLRAGADMIAITENSIYIISSATKKKEISSAGM